jgi:hypothetical protein
MTDIEHIARVVHEANRAHCIAAGDMSHLPWDEAEQWQRDSAIEGVKIRLDDPGMSPVGQHAAWMKHKLEDGWVYGPVKDAEAKTHPCLVAYHLLPVHEQMKDAIFGAIVDAFRNHGEGF